MLLFATLYLCQIVQNYSQVRHQIKKELYLKKYYLKC